MADRQTGGHDGSWRVILLASISLCCCPGFSVGIDGEKKVNREHSIKRLMSSYLAHSFAISPMLLTSDHIY